MIGEGKPLRHVIPTSIMHSNVCMDCTYYLCLDYLRTAIKVGHLFVMMYAGMSISSGGISVFAGGVNIVDGLLYVASNVAIEIGLTVSGYGMAVTGGLTLTEGDLTVTSG